MKGPELRYKPAYTHAQASRALNIPHTTLRYWTTGRTLRDDTEPLISLPDNQHSGRRMLSFANLVEAYVIKALTKSHDISLQAIRVGVQVAEEEYGYDRLLTHRELIRTETGELILSGAKEASREHVKLDRQEQLWLWEMLENYMERVEYDDERIAVQLFPFTREEEDFESKYISIHPGISFGKPTIINRGIKTEIIKSRYDAGEDLETLASEYKVEIRKIKEAIKYEEKELAA